MNQIHPTKSGNFVEERHVYSGPNGTGIIGIKYRSQGTDLEVLYTHQGSENITYPNGWNVYASEDINEPSGWSRNGYDCSHAADLKKVLDGDSFWFPDTGLGVVK